MKGSVVDCLEKPAPACAFHLDCFRFDRLGRRPPWQSGHYAHKLKALLRRMGGSMPCGSPRFTTSIGS